jgi:hypothetical protein
MTLTDVELDALLGELHLATVRRAWRTLLDRARDRGWSHREFLIHLLDTERAHCSAREQRTVQLGAPRRTLEDVDVSAGEPFQPRSNAERWAVYVLRGCEAERDPKTLGCWARAARVSYSSLCESCRLVGVQPREGRDFTRLLRALLRCCEADCGLDAFLDVSDRRTLHALIGRAGIRRGGPPTGWQVAIGDYMRSQRFVAADNSGLRALERLINAPAALAS